MLEVHPLDVQYIIIYIVVSLYHAPYLGAEGASLVRRSPDDVSVSAINRLRNKLGITLNLKHPEARAVFTDLGDAWDFPMDYAEQTPRYLQLVSSEPRQEGPRAILKQIYRLNHSELVQEIVLTAGSARLDFVSRLHWRETQSMLRTSFPA